MFKVDKFCKECNQFCYGDEDGVSYENLISVGVGYCNKKKTEMHENTLIDEECFDEEL